MEELVPFGSRTYWVVLGFMLFARGMDFLSTWVATPNLMLEANPVAKLLGWKWGILLNLVISVAGALWPLPCIVVITTSLLVASRNFQSAWLMRSMGEIHYRGFMAEQLAQAPRGLFLACLAGQTGLFAIVGGALMFFSQFEQLVPFAIGMGLITYAFAVLGFTLLSVWRIRRS